MQIAGEAMARRHTWRRERTRWSYCSGSWGRGRFRHGRIGLCSGFNPGCGPDEVPPRLIGAGLMRWTVSGFVLGRAEYSECEVVALAVVNGLTGYGSVDLLGRTRFRFAGLGVLKSAVDSSVCHQRPDTK